MRENLNEDWVVYQQGGIRDRISEHGMDPDKIKDGVILGSGLGSFAETHMNSKNAGKPGGPIAISFEEIFETLDVIPSGGGVEGHAKELLIGPIDNSDNLVIAQNGREHPYEGISLQRATFWLRVMQALGVKTMIGSNASGILTPDTLAPPALMLVSGDIDCTGQNPLIGGNYEKHGPRFPHMADHYPAKTRKTIKEIAKEMGINLEEGIYARMMGPNYERPEDVYLLRKNIDTLWEYGYGQRGEDRFFGDPVAVVGMSSTYENMVMQHATQSKERPAFEEGRAYISVATNYSASLGWDEIVAPSNHEEVQEKAKVVQDNFGELVKATILSFMKNRKK